MKNTMIDKNEAQITIAAMRSLVIDITNKAKSGHPGMALDIAPLFYVLFKNHLVADPKNPDWIKRDRFVLSSGHACAILYATLHLAGYAISMEDLKSFRQLDSLLPGHPEKGHTPGIDATAGPLGQGIGQAVGFAMAERALNARYPGSEDYLSHYTYCVCGDGCLEEGIGQESISLAGHLKLEKLILFYDANLSTLDGPTTNSMSEDPIARFKALGWNVIEVKDGNDIEAIDEAIIKAKSNKGAPTMILLRTKIGYGTELEGSNKAHGNPLGKELGEKAKVVYNYDYPEFTVPDAVYDTFTASFLKKGEKAFKAFLASEKEYKESYSKDYKVLQDSLKGEIKNYLPKMPIWKEGSADASRNTNGKYVEALQQSCPFMLGGSADVASSVKTAVPGDPGFSAQHYEAKNVNWGIREFGMAVAQNGILLNGGLRSYVGCFLVFADYLKPAIRLAALQKLPAIYLFSHDSIWVGEDGPTHQPIEQLAMLRSIPNSETFRPADAKETWYSWEEALKSTDHPTSLILSRQNLPLLEKSNAKGVSKGGYIVYAPEKEKKNVYQILATGGEVSLAIETAKILEKKVKGASFEVVSLPCLERFDKQTSKYKESVLHVPYENRFSLELLSTFGWAKYAKTNIGLDDFGKSAPGEKVLASLGFTSEKIAKRIISSINK